MSEQKQITIDSSATERVQALRGGKNDAFGEKDYLRITIEGGGCSGFQYKMEADGTVGEDDKLFDDAVIIDDISLQYMKGSTIRFVDDMMGAMFVIDNPNADSSCGCQASFSVNPDAMMEES